MKIVSTCLVLLTAVTYGRAVKEASPDAGIDFGDTGRILTPQNHYNGWVNPEDLTAMPQCIAQQDQSIWLSTMTKCTGRRCTSHFGLICTHQQWLTQLSCLSTGFSPDIVRGYLPLCSRSVLAEAQLYLWIRNITGRTWLADVGDANRLQNLSPASLAEGYAAVDVIPNAPTCLKNSMSALSVESFQHVIASCSFGSTPQHTGNAARPWEYSESKHSMIPLDFETVGYNLAGRSIRYGEYFDKGCFCGAFTMDMTTEPCSDPEHIDLTRERLWMNATCGPTSMPENWTSMLKTTEFAYIPIEGWHWPACVIDIPEKVIELTGRCATDACELDSDGYCKVKRAVDRACFCRDISYGTCGGSCQIFEARIDYVKWLHDLCGNVPDWHGLPTHWRRLAAPSSLDMIPWRWTIKPASNTTLASITYLEPGGPPETCASNEGKLGSLVLVNAAIFLSVFLSRRTDMRRIARSFLWPPHSWNWVSSGISIATLQLLGNWFNVALVQNTLGYEDIPILQLMLLWCSLPRLSWLPILLIGKQPFEAVNISAAASSVFAEAILQLLSTYSMVITVNYGREHNFYFAGMARLEQATPAKFMYGGALLWLIIMIITIVQLMLAVRRIIMSIGPDGLGLPKWQLSHQITPNIWAELMIMLNERCLWLAENVARYWIGTSTAAERTSLINNDRRNYTVYGTVSIKDKKNCSYNRALAKLYAVTVTSMLLLWIAQWLFWFGFIALSSEEYVYVPSLIPPS
ncbi:hypothetical protein P153DRAFT_352009 [Dothidotthia symphoricarpi CBS 119687]|uniref:Extracellular membrane protein CFEM domain-containing protein n=1 Tax=Dothidotthia symphoricarpi CBS 119687 TaxID=1392245 RepID=A0A6A5ZXR1_9PLEO|nr:uncharacterized protein P153DRAFT_352009 [Dothidotthia symphoricarpi CBS 119687]KAF2123557.1 hypothetical protein P153DRAFT_352009 [Dothidotthia symphoricarpi CBS 119687]